MNNSIATINPQLNIQKKRHIIFVLMYLVFMFLIFIRAVVGIAYPVFILLAWFTVTAFVSDRDELLALCLVCIPTATAFQYKYAIFIWIVIYSIKFKDDFKFNLSVLPLVLMIVWELFHQLFYDASLVNTFRFFSELFLLTFMMCLKKRDVDCQFICRIYGYTVCMVGLFVLLNVLKANNYNLNALFESGYYRFGVGNREATSYGLNYNPNSLGCHCNCAIISLMLLRYMKKQILLDYLAVVVLALIGGLTISRSFILTCACIFLIFAFLGNKSGKGRIKMIFITVILFLFIWFVVANFIPSVYDSFVYRFSVADITSGRSGLLDIYDEHIYSSWKYTLFGIGLMDVATKMNQLYGLVTVVPHNGFQELIVVWGYPGLCVFISMFICMIHFSSKNVKKFTIANFTPFIFIIVTSLAGQLITSGFKLLMLSFAYIIMSYDFKKEGL